MDAKQTKTKQKQLKKKKDRASHWNVYARQMERLETEMAQTSPIRLGANRVELTNVEATLERRTHVLFNRARGAFYV